MQGRVYQLIYGQSEDLSQVKVLMVGVGGIGCEVLKIVSKLNFAEFHIIDMDTIEVSNLNRQFLFQQQHRGMAKSQVAMQTMKNMAPQLRVIAYVGAIGSGEYRMDFISQFDVIIMALDNQETRSYINKVCRALGIYLLDAGSMGYKGQSAQYIPDKSNQCYDCLPRSNGQKQYPACTIRQQPSNCVHCVIWGKYLFQQLFSASAAEDESSILEFVGVQKENPYDIFNLFFYKEIVHLKKNPIIIDDHNQSFLPPTSSIQLPIKPCLTYLISLWLYTFHHLHKEKQSNGSITYEKDQWIHTLFIYASTLLRCVNFNIDPLDFQQIKTICGNIIHAIASTNSIVASLEVSKLLQTLNKHQQISSETYLSKGKRERISSIKPQPRNPSCTACLEKQFVSRVDFTQVSMGLLVSELKSQLKLEGDVCLSERTRIIWDDEDEDQVEVMQMKELKDLFECEQDTRLLVSVNDITQVCIWLLHEQNTVCVKFSDPWKESQYFHLTTNGKVKKQKKEQVVQQQIEQPKPQASIMCIDTDDDGDIVCID